MASSKATWEPDNPVAPPRTPVAHIVYTWPDPEDLERGVWECSCGRAGSAREDLVDRASDRHIDYGRGDSRTDRTEVPS